MKSILLLVVGLSAILPSALSATCTCGRENVNTRIINGKEAQRDRYPWLVSLLTKVSGNSYSSCGASIINDRFILTAAHCVASKPRPSDVIAMVGAHTDNERMQAGNGQMKLQVKSIKMHEKYDHDGEKMDDDIALIELATPLTFDEKFNPICLPNFSKYENLFIYGWGRQNAGQTRRLTSAKVLHDVVVDEVANSTCTSRYWGHKFLPNKQVCAGTRAGSCQGDSGGSLSTRSSDGHVYQVAVVSFGPPGCGVEGQMKPDVYERVTAHLDWIERNTQGAKWCPGPQSPALTKRNTAQAGRSYKSGGQSTGSGSSAQPQGVLPSGPRQPSQVPSGSINNVYRQPVQFPGLGGLDLSQLPAGSGAIRVIKYPDGTTKVERIGNAQVQIPSGFGSSFGTGFSTGFGTSFGTGRGLF